MAPLERDLLRAVGPARTRILAQHALRWATYGAAVGLVATAGTLLLASFPQLMRAAGWAVPAAVGAALAVWALGAWRRPRLPEIARQVDRTGLAERLTTCLEFAGQEHPLLDALRADTLRSLQAVDWRQALPWRRPTGALLTSLLACVLILGISLIPNSARQWQRQAAPEAEAVAGVVARLQTALQHAEAEAERRGTATEEIAAILERLREDLKQARTAKEALGALGRAEDGLCQLDRASASEMAQALAEAGQALLQTPETQPLGEALAQRNWQAASSQLEQLASQLQAQSPEAQQALAAALGDAAEQVGNGGAAGAEQMALAEALAEAAQAMITGDLDGAAAALDDVAAAILAEGAEADTTDGQSDTIALLQKELEAAREALAAVAGAEAGEGQTLGTTAGGQEANDGGGGGQISSNVGGSGASRMEGTATEAAKVGQPAPGGDGEPPDARREYSQVFDPTPRLGTDGQASLLQGQATGAGGATQFETPEAKVSAGEFRPYDQVFAQYEEQAMQSMLRVELPPGVQQLVKSYFSALDPANDGTGGAR